MSMILPILPQIAVNTTRLCDGNDDVNCFLDLKGCNTAGTSIQCNDAGGWSASLAFIGTGVSVSTGTNCSEETCTWTIDGAEGCATWNSQGDVILGGALTFLLATELDGDDDTRHTLVVSSAVESNSTDHPILRFLNGTRVYTGPDTPVHPKDYIAISPYYSEVEVEGEWSALDEGLGTRGLTYRRFMGGEGSISAGVVGDGFSMGHSFSYNGKIEDSDEPIVNNTVDGEVTERVDWGLIPLSPGGWYNVGLKASFDANGPIEAVTAYEIIYHPLDNTTRIRDVIPEALVESFDGSPPLSNGLGCAPPEVEESGAASHLRESGGTLLLLPMIFILYALRLKF